MAFNLSRIAGGRPVRKLYGVLLVGPARAGWCAWEVDHEPIHGIIRFRRLGAARWSIPGSVITARTLDVAVRTWKATVGQAIGRAFCFRDDVLSEEDVP